MNIENNRIYTVLTSDIFFIVSPTFLDIIILDVFCREIFLILYRIESS